MKNGLLAAIFLVTWKSFWYVQTGCDFGHPTNPYNGEIADAGISYAVLCTKEETKDMSKTFDGFMEAEQFMAGCKDSTTGLNDPACTDWKIRKVSEEKNQ